MSHSGTPPNISSGPRFSSHEEVDDPLQSADYAHLALPVGSLALIPPHMDRHTPFTTSPAEVAYVIFNSTMLDDEGFDWERMMLELGAPGRELMERQGVAGDYVGRSVGRALLSMALDPDRVAPIHPMSAYHTELRRVWREVVPSEASFFADFVSKYGVVDRDTYTGSGPSSYVDY